MSLWREFRGEEEGYFDLQGTVMRISLKDIYFLTGLPTTGLIQDSRPSFPRDIPMEDLARRLCRDGISGLAQNGKITIEKINDSLTRVVAELVVRIVGSTILEHISGGMILMVERAMVGTQFAWGALRRSRFFAQVRECAQEAGKAFTFVSFLCCFFLERVPSLRPRLYVDELGSRVLGW